MLRVSEVVLETLSSLVSFNLGGVYSQASFRYDYQDSGEMGAFEDTAAVLLAGLMLGQEDVDDERRTISGIRTGGEGAQAAICRNW